MASILTAQTCATVRAPNDWHAIYIRSVLPKLTSADVAWFATTDRTYLSPLPLTALERVQLIADVRGFVRKAGAR